MSEKVDRVEMPKPTVWPMVLSLGLTLIAAGIALSYAFSVIGGMLFFVALVGWMRDLLPGQGHEHEEIGRLPDPIVPRPGTVAQLEPGMTGYRFRLPEKVHPISAGLKGGLVGGLVMPLPALAWGELSGHGIWFPVNLLAGLVLPGVDNASVADLEQFRPGLLALGIVIHAIISATIGLMYGVMLPTIPAGVRSQIIGGGIVVPLIWTGLSYGFMGVANPALQEYVDWRWFAASQCVFGLAAAIVVLRSERVIVPPAGGSPTPPPTTGEAA